MTNLNFKDDGRLIAECRVRYLSFLGIGQNVKNCAFIMHTAEDKFVCHAFVCEPSSGALCKTIEAACKVSEITDALVKLAISFEVSLRLYVGFYYFLEGTNPFHRPRLFSDDKCFVNVFKI